MTVYILDQAFLIEEKLHNSQNIHSKREKNNNVPLNGSHLLIQDFCEVTVGPYKMNIYKNKAKERIHNQGQSEGSGSYDSRIHSYEGDRQGQSRSWMDILRNVGWSVLASQEV